MEGAGEQKKHLQEGVVASSSLVTNGSVDYKGNVADRKITGGWKASPYIIVNEIAERLAFVAIAVNIVHYLVSEMHLSLPEAATTVTNWMGAAYAFALLGAFLADAYLGRFLTIISFSCIYEVGMFLLTLSASIDSLKPPKCTEKQCIPATNSQEGFLKLALYLIALGTGGIKPCVSSFGADQFDDADEKEAQDKTSFFNWFFFSIQFGAIFAITILVYLQEKMGWSWGFAVPTVVMLCSIIILSVGYSKFRYQKPLGSAFTRFLQVIVAAVRNHFKVARVSKGTRLYEVKTTESDICGAPKLLHTEQFRFLDKAAMVTDPQCSTNTRWKLCTVTQVEELKSFIRVLPVWASTIALSISFAQLSTFFLGQAKLMNRELSPHFEIPPSFVVIFSPINALIIIPVFEKLIVPLVRKKTGRSRCITALQRMGFGLFLSIFGLVSAALVEKKRRTHHDPPSLSIFWLMPQYVFMGSAEVFTYVGQLEFFYDEASDGTRSVSSAMFLCEVGIGSWISSAIVKIIEATTGGEEKGWLRNDLNQSHLDYFYWILAGINGVNFLVYSVVAWGYEGARHGRSKAKVRDITMLEMVGESSSSRQGSSRAGVLM